MAEAQQAPLGAAFQKPPAMAQYFKENYQQSAAAEPQGAQMPPVDTTQQQLMTVIAPPTRSRSNPILPQPDTAASVQLPVAAPSQVEETQGAPVPPPSGSSTDMALQRQLEAERRAFAEREKQYAAFLQQREAELAEAQKAQAELAQIKRHADIMQKFADDATFDGLESVDANDARRIIQMAAEAAQQPLLDENQKMREQLQQTQMYAAQQAQAAQAARIRDQLLQAHPDFFQLYDYDPAFKQYLAQRDGMHSYSREQAAIAEYNAGNVGYLINMLNEFKGQKPKTDNMQTVAPVQVANSAPAQAQAQSQQYTLADLNLMMHTGQITPDQYRMMLNKLRAAQPQPA